MQAPQQQPPQKKGMSTCAIIAIVVLALSVPVIGIMAALGIYGVRKYLAAAKTAEAKNNIGFITRQAVAAYERESLANELIPSGGATATHRLCKSATPVPHTVPQAMKYQPSSAPGADFNAGSADTGWVCLKTSITEPIYYQYMYETGTGSGKSGVHPNGFEVSARGDLDGNGKTSFFARGGDVRKGAVVVSTELFIENEFE
jgi:type IV pilus assembly protein PilA